MSVIIKSGSSSDLLTIDVNKAAYIRPLDKNGNDLSVPHRELLPTNQQAILMAGKNDDWSTFFRTDRKGNQIIGNFIPELVESFEGAAINAQKWTAASTTFIPVQSTLAGYNFNATNLTTVNAVSILQSQRLFYKYQRQPRQIKKRLRHSMVSGSIADFGFGVPATTTLVVPNGTQVRFTNSGQVQVVHTVNSVEIAIANVIAQVTENGNTIGADLNMSNAAYTSNYYVYDLIVDDDDALLTVQDTGTGKLIGKVSVKVPMSQYKMWGATALPEYTRLYNNTAPSTAPIFIVSDKMNLSTDMNQNMNASQLAGHIGMTAGRNPFTGIPTANFTNSTAPASATLSNTAAGYTTEGGKYQFAAVAGAETDYALFAYTVPAGSRYLCEGVTITLFNMGAASATTPTLLEWAMGFNSSSVSLATSNIVRIPVGVQSIPVGTAIGTRPDTIIDFNFITPQPVESGRFLHVILRMPVGTATASQIIRGTVTVKGRTI